MQTRLKLKEAEFFFKKLEESLGDFIPPVKEETSYYLSAFVTAAISVTEIMNVEYSSTPWFKAWRREQETSRSPEELKLTKYLRLDLRNANVHRDPLNPDLSGIVVSAMTPVEGNMGDDPKDGQWYAPTTPVGVAWIPTIGDKEFYASCTLYLEYLRKLVDACETSIEGKKHP